MSRPGLARVEHARAGAGAACRTGAALQPVIMTSDAVRSTLLARPAGGRATLGMPAILPAGAGKLNAGRGGPVRCRGGGDNGRGPARLARGAMGRLG